MRPSDEVADGVARVPSLSVRTRTKDEKQ